MRRLLKEKMIKTSSILILESSFIMGNHLDVEETDSIYICHLNRGGKHTLRCLRLNLIFAHH